LPLLAVVGHDAVVRLGHLFGYVGKVVGRS